MFSIIQIEMRITWAFLSLLILLNLTNLYFIIDLFSYDEITGFLPGGYEKSFSPHKLTLMFFITTMSNLFFISVVLMHRLMNK